MKRIRRSNIYHGWINSLRDFRAKIKIRMRIKRLRDGNPGDVKPAGNGISELREHYGPGYRIYYKESGDEIILLLCGGEKSSQTADINKAKEILHNPEKYIWYDEEEDNGNA